MSETASSQLCPKCQTPVKEKDVICLACGTGLKNLLGKSRALGKPAENAVKKVVLTGVPKMPRSVSSLKNLLLFLLSFLVFCGSAGFAWAYFKNFSAFYTLTDACLMRGHLDICRKMYAALGSLALSSNVPELKFHSDQLLKEKKMGDAEVANNVVEMNIRDHYADKAGLHLKLTLKNKSPFQMLIHDRCFYLKTDRGLFPARFPTLEENMGPFKLGTKKSATGGLVFPGIGLFSENDKTFDGKIVFNDGKKYATSDLHLDLSLATPKSADGWALKDASKKG